MKKIIACLTMIFLLIACSGPEFNDDEYKTPPGIQRLSRQKSPDGKKLLTLTEICGGPADSTGCHTQVFIDFGKTGSGVYSVNGKGLDIKTWWKNDDTIVVQTKKAYQGHQRWPKVQSFSIVVHVQYIED